MTPKQLKKISALLPVPLDQVLGVDRKTVWRWVNGLYPMPEHRQEQLVTILGTHTAECLKVLKSLQSSQ